jgi:hypothetical protein
MTTNAEPDPQGKADIAEIGKPLILAMVQDGLGAMVETRRLKPELMLLDTIS